MATATNKTRRAAKARRAGPRYLALVRRFPLMAIRSEADLDRAIVVLDELSDRGRLAADEREYLVVLAALVERYEDEHYPMGRVSDVEMLRYLMEIHGATQADVARGSGINVGTVSSLLAGRRQMTRGHIEALARFFHVSPGVFLPDPERQGR